MYNERNYQYQLIMSSEQVLPEKGVEISAGIRYQLQMCGKPNRAEMMMGMISHPKEKIFFLDFEARHRSALGKRANERKQGIPEDELTPIAPLRGTPEEQTRELEILFRITARQNQCRAEQLPDSLGLKATIKKAEDELRAICQKNPQSFPEKDLLPLRFFSCLDTPLDNCGIDAFVEAGPPESPLRATIDVTLNSKDLGKGGYHKEYVDIIILAGKNDSAEEISAIIVAAIQNGYRIKNRLKNTGDWQEKIEKQKEREELRKSGSGRKKTFFKY